MRVFVSYASEDDKLAREVAHSLKSRGHKVFIDQSDLPAGQNYEEQIEDAIKRSSLMVFLISPESVADGRFTRTELKFAEKKWPVAHRRILPVVVRDTPIDDIPSYLKSVTLLEPQGNIPAEISTSVNQLRSRTIPFRLLTGLILAAVATGWYFVSRPQPAIAINIKNHVAFERGLFSVPEKFNIQFSIENTGNKSDELSKISLETEPSNALVIEKQTPVIGSEPTMIGTKQTADSYLLVSEAETEVPFRWRLCAYFISTKQHCSVYSEWLPGRSFLYGDSFSVVDELKHNSVAVAWDGNNYLVATHSPNRIYRISELGTVLKRVDIEGIPVTISVGPLGIYLGTKNPDSIIKLTEESLSTEFSTTVNFTKSIKSSFDEPVSSTPASMAQDGKHLWLITSGGASGYGLAYISSDLSSQTVPPFYHEIDSELSDMSLKNGYESVWSGQSQTTPASLFKFGTGSMDIIEGHDYEIVSCATDVLPDGNRLWVPNCEGRVEEILYTNGEISPGSSLDSLKGFKSNLNNWQISNLLKTADNKPLGAVSVDERNEQLEIVEQTATVSALGWNDGSSMKFDASNARIIDIAAGRHTALIILESDQGKTQLVSPGLYAK